MSFVFAGSSSGRTSGSEPENLGSNPGPAAIKMLLNGAFFNYLEILLEK